jgi:hypothetical protein
MWPTNIGFLPNHCFPQPIEHAYAAVSNEVVWGIVEAICRDCALRYEGSWKWRIHSSWFDALGAILSPYELKLCSVGDDPLRVATANTKRTLRKSAAGHRPRLPHKC